MATKGKDVGSTGKEKKGTSSPSKRLQSGSTKRSFRPSSNLESTEKDRSSSPSTRKQTPSYLKPTISSQNIRKEDSFLSPSIQRRRSFDKLPSHAQIRKALLSPNHKRPTRSSSVTPAKPSAPPKPASDRSSRTPRLVKSHTIGAKWVSVKKAAATKNVVAETGDKLYNESQYEDLDSSLVGVVQEEEVKSVDKVVEVESSSIEPNSDEGEKLKPCDQTLTENHQSTEDIICDQESKDEINGNHPEESSWDEPKVEDSLHKVGEEDEAENPISKEGDEPSIEDSGEVENKGEEPSVIKDSGEDRNKGEEPSIEDSREDQNKDKAEEEVDDGGSQKRADEDEEKQKNVVEEEKPKAENPALSKQQSSANGKKDSQVQNEVIEEFASKLLEKRKNKVRALVGAFETVISLQEPDQA